VTPEQSDYTLPLIPSEDWIDQVENTDQGEPLPTPFSWGMNAIPANRKGRMTAIGANTGFGKTALGLQTFKYTVDGLAPGERACYITTEMTPADIFERLQYQFETPEECKAWIKEKGAVISQPGVDATEVALIIRDGGFAFVVVDHIHDLPFEGHEDLARKVRRIAAMAPYSNTGVLMLGQTKQPDPLSKRPPSRYDFSYTKAIAEVASLAFILHKEEEDDEDVELHCVKNRFGPLSSPLKLRLNRRTVMFEAI
jgi:hypothetical protein